MKDCLVVCVGGGGVAVGALLNGWLTGAIAVVAVTAGACC